MDEWIQRSSDSFQKFTGKTLYQEMTLRSIDNNKDITSPGDVHNNTQFAVLSHGVQDDPIYNYFNEGAFLAFGFDPETVYQLPSRYSAPDGKVRSERSALLAQTTTTVDTNVTIPRDPQNDIQPPKPSSSSDSKDILYLDNAIRQRQTGELFAIDKVILWNVYDKDFVTRIGQTAIFDRTKVVPVLKENENEDGSNLDPEIS